MHGGNSWRKTIHMSLPLQYKNQFELPNAEKSNIVNTVFFNLRYFLKEHTMTPNGKNHILAITVLTTSR